MLVMLLNFLRRKVPMCGLGSLLRLHLVAVDLTFDASEHQDLKLWCIALQFSLATDLTRHTPQTRLVRHHHDRQDGLLAPNHRSDFRGPPVSAATQCLDIGRQGAMARQASGTTKRTYRAS